MHGRIFGGFLMRRAYELAFATVHMFAGRRPRFVEVDRVDFTRPVDVGDLVTFQSAVLHTKTLMDHPDGPRGLVYVEVEASVNRPESVSSATTNRFLLTCVLPASRVPLWSFLEVYMTRLHRFLCFKRSSQQHLQTLSL